MKTKTIPFDAKMAKKIQAGEIKGKIKTKDGSDVLIVLWDKKDEDGYVILALVDMPATDLVASYTRNGKISKECESEHDLVLEVPDNEPQFKPFDKVLVRTGEGCWQCALFSHMSNRDDFPYFANAFAFEQCIPYAGNEHLVGTTDKPKED